MTNETLKRKIFLESTIRVYESEIKNAREIIKDRTKTLKRVKKELEELMKGE